MSLAEFDALGSLERDLWIAEWQAAQERCAECGQPAKDCSDPQRLWYPIRRICYATREAAAAQEAYEALHEKAPFHDGTYQSWSSTRSAMHPYRYSHGVTIGVARENEAPWDAFTTQVDASPVIAEQEAQEAGYAHRDGGEGYQSEE